MTENRCVLHLAMDYPNRNRPNNTPAVRNFVTKNPGVDYFVVALRRVAWPWQCNTLQGDGEGDEKVVSMAFWGLPFGIGLVVSMWIVALRTRALIRQRELQFDAVHGHKFAFEGIAAWWLSRWFKKPLILSVRGNSDHKIIRYKPFARPLLGRMLQHAKAIYYVSAWYRPILNQYFEVSQEKQKLLPNFVKQRQQAPASDFDPFRLVTILDLNQYRDKGLDKLLHALKLLEGRYPKMTLDVVGKGSDSKIKEINTLIAELNLEAKVRLTGPIPNQELIEQLSQYAGLVLPTQHDAFGMVYVEALLSGVAVVYSKGTGIDGFIDDIKAKVGIDPQSITDIAAGTAQLLDRQQEFRHWLLRYHYQIKAQFSAEPYLSGYKQLIQQV
ncbi:glycosyltransferase [Paraferrimonas sedimenticola]|uniref:Uncharacterized protein n=1 Tax=Paraferrimonas sedimenticola TaxID=375674 RepID=A0AA37VV46_9GAMM|nr:glycosyltransferase [Paraferrimonas sedimenticola]GLP96024.1 hypothetical protein GCM10007895_13300 [Paraferrimonas sedimenticola]